MQFAVGWDYFLYEKYCLDACLRKKNMFDFERLNQIN
jgi:hypothetical protein